MGFSVLCESLPWTDPPWTVQEKEVQHKPPQRSWWYGPHWRPQPVHIGPSPVGGHRRLRRGGITDPLDLGEPLWRVVGPHPLPLSMLASGLQLILILLFSYPNNSANSQGKWHTSLFNLDQTADFRPSFHSEVFVMFEAFLYLFFSSVDKSPSLRGDNTSYQKYHSNMASFFFSGHFQKCSNMFYLWWII